MLNLYGVAVLNAFGAYKEILLPDPRFYYAGIQYFQPGRVSVFLSAKKTMQTEIGNKVGN